MPAASEPIEEPVDQLGRSVRDLRISVTDRCNFRCGYCMPEEVFTADYPYLQRSEILRYEEIQLIARILSRLGVKKLRLTGGEPLLRKDLSRLIELLASIDGIEDLALTTNGVLLPQKAASLKEAGLKRITVSLDALDTEIFHQMSGRRGQVDEVLEGIDAAINAGFSKIKVNAVIKRGVNEGEILPLLERFRGTPVTIRFIEFMDVGTTNKWDLSHVVPTREIVDLINKSWPIEPVDPAYRGEVATRYRFKEGSGEVGFISSVTQPFCGDCSRLRLSARGELFTCLFASQGTDLRELLRSSASEEQLSRFITNLWELRKDRYSEERGNSGGQDRRIEMSYIGG